jgi:hypothetical protein
MEDMKLQYSICLKVSPSFLAGNHEFPCGGLKKTTTFISLGSHHNMWKRAVVLRAVV